MSSGILHHVRPSSGTEPAVQVRGVIFDMDGTLIHEGIDYVSMRSDIGIPYPKDVIQEIRAMENVEEQKRLWDIIERHEDLGRENLRAHDGVSELLEFLRSHDIKIGLFTRNSTRGIEAMKTTTGYVFDMEMSRDFDPPKPFPDGALHIAKTWNLEPSSILFVGDSGDDVNCGNSAGMKSVLFDPESKRTAIHHLASLVITSMADLQALLDAGVVL